jgi:outer membrane protein assembly factor BamB
MRRLAGRLVGLMAVVYSTGAIAGPAPEPLRETWSRLYGHITSHGQYYEHGFPQFSGVADPEGNLYWTECVTSGYGMPQFISCSLLSTDLDGRTRFYVDLGVRNLPPYFDTLFVEGGMVVSQFGNTLTSRETTHGSVLWTRDLRDELGSDQIIGINHDGKGQTYVSAKSFDGFSRSTLLALSASTGETVWRRDLAPDESHTFAVGLSLLDESGNLYVGGPACSREPDDDGCKGLLFSFDRSGAQRFQIQTDWASPLAASDGRVLLSNGDWLDAESGEIISRSSYDFFSNTVSPRAGLAFLSSARVLGFSLRASTWPPVHSSGGFDSGTSGRACTPATFWL